MRNNWDGIMGEKDLKDVADVVVPSVLHTPCMRRSTSFLTKSRTIIWIRMQVVHTKP